MFVGTKTNYESAYVEALLETLYEEILSSHGIDDESFHAANKEFAFRFAKDFADVCSTIEYYGLDTLINPDYVNFENYIRDMCELNVQSDMIQDNCCDADGDNQQQVVHFGDQEPGDKLDIPHSINYANMDTSANCSLSEFLSRPVEIATISWAENTVLDTSVNPWNAYFSHTSIKKKLDNFFLIRCNLHVKIQINASPFYYGIVLTSYRPMTNFNPCPVHDGVGVEDHAFMGKSQRPHVYLYPQNCQGAEMVLPFFWYKQWLDATKATALTDMGTLNFDSLTVLKNANSTAGTNCNIQVFAWAEDVELAGPTTSLAVQSDEYSDDGPVSAPASAVAKYADKVNEAADKLSSITGGASLLIKPFATATSLAATAVGSIARLFGYTNVPVIADVHAMKSQPFPHFASPSIGTPVEKLTLDPKNELSIDPKICGVDAEDELQLTKFVARECFIDTFIWSATDTPDTLLWNMGVTPELMKTGSLSGQTIVTGSPGWMVCQGFQAWRGDMILRLKFICSQFHRGRVRVQWDPHATLGGITQATTEVYTEIIDLSSTTDYTVRIPYCQETPYLKTIQPTISEYYGVASESLQYQNFNGTLSIRVVTEQTSPVATADIDVFAYVSWAENFSVAGPTEYPATIVPYAVQSKETDELETEEIVLGGVKGDNPSYLNLMHYGEVLYSLRSLMRRTTLHRAWGHRELGAKVLRINNGVMSRLPLLPGFDPNGIHTAQELIGAGSAPYNYVEWSALTWFSQCFVGNKGSIMWHLNVDAPQRSGNVTFARSESVKIANNYDNWNSASGTPNDNVLAELLTSTTSSLMQGASVTNQESQAGVSIQVPMYSRFKFLTNDATVRTLGTSEDDSDVDSIQSTSTFFNTSVGDVFTKYYYVGAGTDYTPVFYLNVPGLYRQSSIPNPTP